MPVNARRCHGNFGTLSLFLCRIIKCHRARQSAPARRFPRWPLSAISGTPESKPAVVLDREGHRRGDTGLGLRYLGFCCGVFWCRGYCSYSPMRFELLVRLVAIFVAFGVCQAASHCAQGPHMQRDGTGEIALDIALGRPPPGCLSGRTAVR